jgi:outer membrane receptor protein involved in Fe transport
MASARRRRRRGSGDTDSGALQEIIVTAQRRSQNIQDVPISMQAFTSETLQQLNITQPSTTISSSCRTSARRPTARARTRSSCAA